MFDEEIRFSGTHARKVIALTEKLEGKYSIFDRVIDIYINASIIGFLYNKKQKKNTDRDSDEKELTKHIFLDTLHTNKKVLMFNYRLIMLLDENYEKDMEKRINKAFGKTENLKEDLELYNSYVRGGIDIIYEKLIENSKNAEEIMEKLCFFIIEFQNKFNNNIDMKKVHELCIK